jgi:uncharacterized protein YfdQ (DUF2303 family)
VAEVVRAGLAPLINPIAVPVPHVLWPGERRVDSLERLCVSPVRKRAVVEVRDYMSCIDYVARHQEPGSVIFAVVREDGGCFTAILDYHGNNELGGNIPRWGDHTCRYVCEHSPEWKRWLQRSGEAMSQVSMALFIEDNLIDIIEPEAARMLEMVKTLEATQGVEFKSLVRLDNGDRGLHYSHTTAAKAGQQGDMEIPEKFKLKIAVFENGPGYDVECRFRYRIKDGSLSLGYEVIRPHKIVDLALTEARTAIVQALPGVPVMRGSALIPAPGSRVSG